MPAPIGPEAVLRPFAKEFIKQKAIQLTRKPGCHRDEREDLIQEITIRVILKLPMYDPQRCSVDGFIRVVANSAASLIARERRAEKRGAVRGNVSLSAGEDRGSGKSLGAMLLPSDAARRLGVDTQSAVNPEAVHGVIATMPPELESICKALMTQGKAEAARTLGIRRQRIHDLIPKMRDFFSKAGHKDPLDFD
ncbi:MAG TPA: sigma factor [Phycisphaerae bacterium]|nr:sigma factor [Phycisphaerae bacterium]